MSLLFINPDRLMKSPAFSQVVVTSGAGRTIYIGGQNAVNEKLDIIGKGDLAAQTVQVMQNIGHALEAVGAGFEHLIKLNIYMVQGVDAYAGFKASQPFLAKAPNPPVITGVFVSALNHPEYLIEIEALAFLPE